MSLRRARRQSGFGLIEVMLIIAVIALVGFVGWVVWNVNNPSTVLDV